VAPLAQPMDDDAMASGLYFTLAGSMTAHFPPYREYIK
jgi:hypothetical protein